jgi:hypothetical protein
VSKEKKRNETTDAMKLAPVVSWRFALQVRVLVLFSLSLFGIIYANRAVVFTPKNVAKVHTKGR